MVALNWIFIITKCTHRDASFVEVGEAFLQLSVQHLLWNHDGPRQAVRTQRTHRFIDRVETVERQQPWETGEMLCIQNAHNFDFVERINAAH